MAVEPIGRIHDVLEGHPVSFALLFGSAAREEPTTPRDVDIVVEFESHRPGDDGYFERYVALLGDLEAAADSRVDLVDVRSMSPQFARIAFDEGRVLVGTDDRRAALEREFAGEPPSAAEARERVAAVADRLREEPPVDS